MPDNQRFIIVFNGEIYNHISLRNDIISAGWPYSWRGHSDTETLLAALQLWGLVDTLKRLKGMFAFALWDQKTDRWVQPVSATAVSNLSAGV